MSHYLEDEGLPTTGISLVRENTVLIRPPRALWVPFELGRPFGAPGEPAFQARVLRAALALLERTDGPAILEDFPEDAPARDGEDDEPLVCPVSFPRRVDPDDPAVVRAVREEMDRLAPWYALARETRGRTTVGVSGLEIDGVVDLLAALLDGRVPEARDGVPPGEGFRLACEDLRAWHLEAMAARPGAAGADSARALADWFWGETAAGALLLALHPACMRSPDPGVRIVAETQLVPRAQRHRLRSDANQRPATATRKESGR